MSVSTINTASPLHTVAAGPFKDVSSNPGEITRKYDASSGREYLVWDTHARTRHFLDVFAPKDGWKVVVIDEPLGIQMLDQFTYDSAGQPVYQEAWKFTATLLDKDNNPVSNGSTIQLLNCPMALEIGQTRARSKLYQALGLPSSPDSDFDDAQLPLRQPASAPAIPKVEIHAVVDDVPAAPASAPAPAVAVLVPAAATPPADEPVDEAAEPDSDEREPAVLGITAVVDDVPDAVTSLEPEHTSDSDPELPAVSVTPAPAAAAVSDSARAKADAKVFGTIPNGLLRQISQRAARAKVAVPPLDTLDQAQAFLATLVNPNPSTSSTDAEVAQ